MEKVDDKVKKRRSGWAQPLRSRDVVLAELGHKRALKELDEEHNKEPAAKKPFRSFAVELEERRIERMAKRKQELEHERALKKKEEKEELERTMKKYGLISYSKVYNVDLTKPLDECTDEELIMGHCEGVFCNTIDKETALKEAPTLRKYLKQAKATGGFDIVDWPQPGCLPMTGVWPAERSPERDVHYKRLVDLSIQKYNKIHGKDFQADQLVQVNQQAYTHYYITFSAKVTTPDSTPPPTFHAFVFYRSEQEYRVHFCRLRK